MESGSLPTGQSGSLPEKPRQRVRCPGRNNPAVLALLHATQENSLLDSTGPLPIPIIASKTGLSYDSVKTSLRRLLQHNLIEVMDSRRGTRGYRSYKITGIGRRYLRESGSQLASESGSLDPESSSCSSSLQRQTTRQAPAPPPLLQSSTEPLTDKLLAKQFEDCVQRLGIVDELKLGSNDLLGVWRQRAFNSIEEFLTSVEHLAFYVSSDQAEGIKHPKAWLLKKLRQGYYPQPAGYVSREEQIAETRLRDAQNKLRRLRELEEQRLDADFEVWLTQKSREERVALLSGNMFNDPNSMAAKAILRQKFCEETGVRDPCPDVEEARG